MLCFCIVCQIVRYYCVSYCLYCNLTLMVDGSPASADIAPVSGTLHFTTAERSQPLVLTIQPDIIPEIDEVS